MSRIALGVVAVALLASSAHADTIIAGGNLPGASNTWTLAGSPYIIQGDVTVPAGATLTIDAGVEVRATANSDSQGSGDTAHVEFNIAGSLDVNGTANSPVVFKSSSTTGGTWYGIVVQATATSVSFDYARIEDPIHGITYSAPGSVIQTNNLTVDSASQDGLLLQSGTPALDKVTVITAGTYGVRILGDSSPALTNCVVRNSGSYGVWIANTSPGHSVSFDNCTLNSNGAYNLVTTASNTNSATVTITDSIITNGGYGVARSDLATINVTYSNVWNNSSGNFSGPSAGTGCISANPLFVSTTDLRLTSNSPSRFGAGNAADQGALPYDTVATPGLYGTLWSNTTLTAANSPHRIDGDLTIPQNVTLTIEPGATLQFQPGDIMKATGDATKPGNTSLGELIIRGKVTADGTPALPITIKSTSTTSGTWYGVELDTTAANVLLDNVVISRATVGLTYRSTGNGNTITNVTADTSSSHGLLMTTGSPTIDGFQSILAGTYGIQILGDSSPTLTNCVVRNSGSYGIWIAHTTPGQSVTIDNCTFNSNGAYNLVTTASNANSATVTITDSIFTNGGYGIARSDLATINVSYSNVWNNSSGNFSGPSAGPGCISTNPLFVSTTDLRLTSNSPSRFGASNGADQGALPYDNVATPGLYGTLWTNTTLTAATSPHRVDGDLTIPQGVTLTIEPGATLQFQAGSDIMKATGDATKPGNTSLGELTVRGKLIADGTTAQPITMTSTSTTSGTWYGVDLDATAANTVLDNVIIGRATVALTYRSTGNGNSITNVTADTASSHGMLLRTGSPTIDGFRAILSGTYGIQIIGDSSPTLTNCIVRNSGSYGLWIAHTTPGQSVTLKNCTFNSNGAYNVVTTASNANSATVTITNSIITNGGYGVARSDLATITVTYSDVWNNSSGNFSGPSAGTGCISANPLFVSTTDLHLQGTSVAIDSGTTGPNHDADGIARPLDGNALAGAQYDMGAYEFVLMAQCGNGSVEPGEFCDSGANNGMYGYCNANCTALGPRCGDGMMNGTEQCDDGNATNTDACLNTCMSATCGDGFVRAGTEQCDDGNQFNTDVCTNQCMTATCGDGYVRAGMEACDDGNQSNTDACLTTCVAASCGDGYIEAGIEQCDDHNSINTDACLNTCAAASCGDGFIQSGMEACDDGNMIATDNCTATCTVATCGDGVVHAGVEECDDANQADTDACVSGCKLAACGDGYIRAGVEVCDDGNMNNTDGCSNMCVSTTCGDGIVQAETEECDDGNMVDTDACRYNCADAACGDGVVRDGVEDCDDGNVMAGDGCSPACKVEGTGSGSGSDVDPGTPDDGGGCCQTSGGVGGSWLLALLVLGMIRRRR